MGREVRYLGIKTQEVGIARVDISCMEFIKGRKIDRRIIDYLKGIFEASKCGDGSREDTRYNPDNYIPVLFRSLSELKKILKESKKTRKDLKATSLDSSPCFLRTAPGQKLLCLDGRHRMEAAKEFLRPGNRWWTVRLLLQSDHQEHEKFVRCITDQYLHQSKLSDGEVYLRVRQCKREKSSKSEIDYWMARLTRCKKENLNQVMKYEGNVQTSYFSSLAKFPALFGRMELGNTHKHFALKCHTEAMRYSRRIEKAFDKITLGSEDIRQALSIEDVEALELRAPGVSSKDRHFIVSAMKNNILFSTITNKEIRRSIEKAILSIKFLIPSIKSMHENFKLLGEGAKVLKELLTGRNIQHTLESTLKSCWTYNGTVYIDMGNGTHRKLCNVPQKKAWKIVYQQLWITAVRSFAELGGRYPRMEADRNARCFGPNPKLQYEFVKFARKNGITPRTEQAQDPRRLILNHSLGQIYQPITPLSLETLVNQLLPRLPTVAKAAVEHDENFDSVRPRDDRTRRWGVPFQDDYLTGQNYLFLPKLLNNVSEKPNDMPTVRFVQRDFIHAFFGSIPLLEMSNEETWEESSSDDSDDREQGGSISKEREDTEMPDDTGLDDMDINDQTQVPPSVPNHSQFRSGVTPQEVPLFGRTTGDPEPLLFQSPVESRSDISNIRTPTFPPGVKKSSVLFKEPQATQNNIQHDLSSPLSERENSPLPSVSPAALHEASKMNPWGLPSEGQRSPLEFPLSVSSQASESQTGGNFTVLTSPQEETSTLVADQKGREVSEMLIGIPPSPNAPNETPAAPLADDEISPVDPLKLPRTPNTSFLLSYPLQMELVQTPRTLDSSRGISSGSSLIEIPKDPRRSVIAWSAILDSSNSYSQVSEFPIERRRSISESSNLRTSVFDLQGAGISGEDLPIQEYQVIELPKESPRSPQIIEETLPHDQDSQQPVPNHNRYNSQDQSQSDNMLDILSQEASQVLYKALPEVPPSSLNEASADIAIKANAKATRMEILTFLEFNGMRLTPWRLSNEAMHDYLKKRRGWVMFVQESKTTFRTIPHHNIVPVMLKSPGKVYCLVEQSKVRWWIKRGANQVEQQNTKKLNKMRKLRVRGHIKVTTFNDNLDLLECEEGWRDRKGSFDDGRTYLLVYHNSKTRTLQSFGDQSLDSTYESSILQSPNIEFITLFQNKCTQLSKDQVKAVAREHPVWLLSTKQHAEFSNQIESQLQRPREVRAITVAPPPELGGSYGEETLFDSSDSDSRQPTPVNSLFAKPLIEAAADDGGENLRGSEPRSSKPTLSGSILLPAESQPNLGLDIQVKDLATGKSEFQVSVEPSNGNSSRIISEKYWLNASQDVQEQEQWMQKQPISEEGQPTLVNSPFAKLLVEAAADDRGENLRGSEPRSSKTTLSGSILLPTESQPNLGLDIQIKDPATDKSEFPVSVEPSNGNSSSIISEKSWLNASQDVQEQDRWMQEQQISEKDHLHKKPKQNIPKQELLEKEKQEEEERRQAIRERARRAQEEVVLGEFQGVHIRKRGWQEQQRSEEKRSEENQLQKRPAWTLKKRQVLEKEKQEEEGRRQAIREQGRRAQEEVVLGEFEGVHIRKRGWREWQRSEEGQLKERLAQNTEGVLEEQVEEEEEW